MTPSSGVPASGPSAHRGRVTGDIQVISRSAQVLRLFSTSQRSLRVGDVSTELDLQRSTVHRYLSSLANAGFLNRNADGGYGLGPLLVQLGTIALRGLRVLDLAGPYLEALADDAGETAVIAVWGGTGPVVAGVHQPRDRLVNLSVRIGHPLPIESAQSQAFLAFDADRSAQDRLLMQLSETRRREVTRLLEGVRSKGYAMSASVVQGVRAIAVPVFEGAGGVCATVAIVGTVSSVPEVPPAGLLQALADAAERLSRELGYSATLPFQSATQAARSAS